MSIDVEGLLSEISPDAPCGQDLEYDPAFVEMIDASQGKAEQQMGDQVIDAVPPDWKNVRGKALEVLGRSRDLRAAVFLARALIHVEGPVGLEAGLAVIQGLLDRHWDQVHPQLDPDDDNDPTMRVNTLAALCDKAATLDSVHEMYLVESRAIGRFSLRDVHIATGETPPPSEGESPDLNLIDGAFLDCPVEDLEATSNALGSAAERAKAIEDKLTNLVGSSRAVDLSALGTVIRAAHAVVADRLARRGVGDGAPDAGGVPGEAGAEVAGQSAPGGAAAGPQPVQGEITSREDVIRMLDKMCSYFERIEPSSPVPLLLKRAKRLVSKNFMDILSDLAPEGVPQAELIRGLDSGDS